MSLELQYRGLDRKSSMARRSMGFVSNVEHSCIFFSITCCKGHSQSLKENNLAISLSFEYRIEVKKMASKFTKQSKC